MSSNENRMELVKENESSSSTHSTSTEAKKENTSRYPGTTTNLQKRIEELGAASLARLNISGSSNPPYGFKQQFLEESLDNPDVQYESEDDNTPPTGRQYQAGWQSNGANFGAAYPQGAEGPWPQTNLRSNSSARGPVSPQGSLSNAGAPRQKNQVTVEQLGKIGHFKKLSREAEEFNLVKEYINNSHDVGRRGTVKIHEIYQNVTKKEPNKISSKGAGGFKSKYAKPAKPDYRMLLWCKTTPETIKHLSDKDDSCMAFYDRLSRAFPIAVPDIKDSLRITVLLSSVSLGNVYKSPNGYKHWKKNTLPYSYNSVKGTGKYIPNWEDNQTYKGTIVPSGETQINKRFPSYEIDFNEYIVYKSSKIVAQFAVDVEIVTTKAQKD